MTNKLLVVGVGNALRGDDGIGPKLVEWLKGKVMGIDYLTVTDLFSLLDVFPNYQQVVIIDAVNMNASAGTVKLFTPQEGSLTLHDGSSTHGFGLAELIKLVELLNLKVDLRIIGIQVKDTNFSLELSSELQEQWEQIGVQVKDILDYYLLSPQGDSK